jgi:hypothetical protein
LATDRLVDDAKNAPAIPIADTTLRGRFTFKLRFACGIAEFLLATFIRTNAAAYPSASGGSIICDEERRSGVKNKHRIHATTQLQRKQRDRHEPVDVLTHCGR